MPHKISGRSVWPDRITLLSRKQLAQRFGVSEWTIWDWSRKGRLPKPIRMTPHSPHKWRACDIELMLDRMQRKAQH